VARGSRLAKVEASLAEAVERARADRAFVAAVGDVLRGVDAPLAKLAPSCQACGECCHFDQAAHRLYVTTGELALLTENLPDGALWAPKRCPYQRDERCTARARRPLGCRTFFCDARVGEACSALYEPAHQDLCRLHARHGVPYQYRELTAALAELRAAAKDRRFLR